MLPIINTDFIMSLGPACRPAQSLKRNNLRFISSPFDWMMNYDINHILYFFENNFDSFFSEFCEIGISADKRKVKDLRTGMISIHDFPINVRLVDYYPYFKEKMLYRFKRLKRIFETSSHIVFITNRLLNFSHIKEFLLSFEKIYNNLTFVFINVTNSDNPIIECNRYIISSRSVLFDLRFLDEHFAGNTPSNPLFWQGNVQLWDLFLSRISIDTRVVTEVLRECDKFNN